MKFDQKSKIEAAANYNSREFYAPFLLRDDNLRAYVASNAALGATNGRILALVRVTEADSDHPDRVEVPVLKNARVVTPKGEDVGIVAGDRHFTLKTGTIMPRQMEHNEEKIFPDVTKVIPSRAQDRDDAVMVTLDIKLLKELADAIGAQQIALHIPTKSKEVSGAIRVERNNLSESDESRFIGVGVIMPIASV